jgi:Rrf2 family protein
MIGISAKAEYAVRAVLHLTLHAGMENPVQLSEISRLQKIPRDFLIQVMSALIKNGIVLGRRGAQGGYVLRTTPSSIFLKDVISAIDGPLSKFRCGDVSFKNCLGAHLCSFRPIWETITFELTKSLQELNFEQISQSARKT